MKSERDGTRWFRFGFAAGVLGFCLFLWLGPVAAMTRLDQTSAPAPSGADARQRSASPPAVAPSRPPTTAPVAPTSADVDPEALAAPSTGPDGRATVRSGSVEQRIIVVVPPRETIAPPGTAAPNPSTPAVATTPEVGSPTSGELPYTGVNALTLRLLVVAIALIDIGWLLRSLSRIRRARVQAQGALA